MNVLAVNGAPNKNSFTEEVLAKLLDAAGQSDSIINLKEYSILPCTGCRGCIKTNTCVQCDDWDKVSAQLTDADIIILGFPTFYGAAFGVNALTHNFLERWFSLRHNGLKMRAKKVVAVATSGEGHGQLAVERLKTFLEAYHGIELADSIVVEGITPCYVCGEGETCVLSCVLARHGENTKITPELIANLGRQPSVIEKAVEIGEKIRTGNI